MNKQKQHVYVIPEDRADEQLANGFVNHHVVDNGQIQVMPPAGGWPKVLSTFEDEYVQILRNCPLAHVVMLIDFDDRVQERRAKFEQAIPGEFKTRVFVVGPRETPEKLKHDLNKHFEKIGASLADDCDAGTTVFWAHEQLNHNDSERQRLVEIVKPFLLIRP